MFAKLSVFFNGVKEARFNFDVIWQWLTSVFKAITENPDVLSVWNGIMTLVAPIYTPFIVTVILLCLLSTFFGRKLIGFIKFLVFFILGFVLATHFIAPLIPAQIHIAPWIIGFVVALIAAVLSRFLYTVFYFIFFSYGTYATVFFLLLLNPAEAYSDTKAVICLLISIAVTVLAFVFRQYVEMAVTSVFGAWATVVVFARNIHNFAAFPSEQGIALFVVTALLSALGLTVQVITRRRY